MNIMSYEEFVQSHDKDSLIYEETYKNYIREAVRFFSSNKSLVMQDAVELSNFFYDNYDTYVAMLQRQSARMTSNAWRKLRRSIVVFFMAVGENELANSVSKIKNATPENKRPSSPGRKLRLTTVRPESYEKLHDDRREAKDVESCSLLTIARLTGARPVEMPNIEIIDFNPAGNKISLFIKGAKKTAKGDEGYWQQRGIDRVIHLELSSDDLVELAVAIHSANKMSYRAVKNCQERIRKAANRVFRSTVRKFCLYSLRYTMGSNLKAAYRNHKDRDIIIAAIMGHRCTSSQSYYGNIRAGVKTGVPKADKETLKKVKRDTQRYCARLKAIGANNNSIAITQLEKPSLKS